MLRINQPVIYTVTLYVLCQVAVAGSQPESKFTHVSAATTSLTCNLVDFSGQCREYTVLAGANETLGVIKDGCLSMSGSLGTSGCPETGLIAQCIDIVRNYKKPDAIYDAYYYAGKKNSLLPEDIHRVCEGLGGEYLNLAN